MPTSKYDSAAPKSTLIPALDQDCSVPKTNIFCIKSRVTTVSLKLLLQKYTFSYLTENFRTEVLLDWLNLIFFFENFAFSHNEL